MTTDLKTEIKEEPKEKKILVDKAKIDSLIERLNQLELLAAGGGTPEIKRPDFHIARIRTFEDKVVTKFGKTWNIRDDYNEELLMLEVTTEDDKTHEVKYLKFMQDAPRIDAKIINSKTTNKVRKEGFVELTDVQGYRTIGMGSKIAVEVVEPETESEIQLPDGRTLWLNNLAFNS